MFDGNQAIRRKCAFVSLRFKESGNDFTDGFFVVNDQNVFRRHWAYLPCLLYGTAHDSNRCDCPFLNPRASFDTCRRSGLSGPASSSCHLSTSVNQFVEKLLSPVSSQGQLSVAFFQVSAFVILLVLYLILYKDVKARFLRFWVVGWALLTCGAITRLVEQLYDSRLESAIVQITYFLAVSFMLAAVLEYLRPFRDLNEILARDSFWRSSRRRHVHSSESGRILSVAMDAGNAYQRDNAHRGMDPVARA